MIYVPQLFCIMSNLRSWIAWNYWVCKYRTIHPTNNTRTCIYFLLIRCNGARIKFQNLVSSRNTFFCVFPSLLNIYICFYGNLEWQRCWCNFFSTNSSYTCIYIINEWQKQKCLNIALIILDILLYVLLIAPLLCSQYILFPQWILGLKLEIVTTWHWLPASLRMSVTHSTHFTCRQSPVFSCNYL